MWFKCLLLSCRSYNLPGNREALLMKRTALSVSFILLFMLSCSTVGTKDSATSLDMTSPLPVAAKLIEKKLENGLSYYVWRNTEPANRARIMLVVKAGSLQEEEGQRGAAHF